MNMKWESAWEGFFLYSAVHSEDGFVYMMERWKMEDVVTKQM